MYECEKNDELYRKLKKTAKNNVFTKIYAIKKKTTKLNGLSAEKKTALNSSKKPPAWATEL